MSDKTAINLCVLWEHELRTASRLLQEAFDANQADEDERGEKIARALIAAHVALKGLDENRVAVLLSAAPSEKSNGN